MDESIIKHLEQKQTLKLSDAIRIGARLRPQGRSHLFYKSHSCALGAALEAVYGPPPSLLCMMYSSEWLDTSAGMLLQKTFGMGLSMQHQLEDWNDTARLTREQIADKLEELGY